MAHLIAQLSDVHIGGPHDDNGDRFSAAIGTINEMTRAPDLVLLTGDLTHNGSPAEWQEVCDRLGALNVPWQAIPGNHDRGIQEIAGNRIVDSGPLRLVLLDTSNDVFTEEDERWLDTQLATDTKTPTVTAIHQPPFETGIWWMDCVGLKDPDRLERVVRNHPQVIKVLSGHVHRLIQSNWGSCSLWACPSTSPAVAVDLDPDHAPAESAEPPTFSLHAWTGSAMVSHIVPIGSPSVRSPIDLVAPDFVQWVRGVQSKRNSTFQ